jgi:hypothetical protein
LRTSGGTALATNISASFTCGSLLTIGLTSGACVVCMGIILRGWSMQVLMYYENTAQEHALTNSTTEPANMAKIK